MNDIKLVSRKDIDRLICQQVMHWRDDVGGVQGDWYGDKLATNYEATAEFSPTSSRDDLFRVVEAVKARVPSYAFEFRSVPGGWLVASARDVRAATSLSRQPRHHWKVMECRNDQFCLAVCLVLLNAMGIKAPERVADVEVTEEASHG